VAIVDRTQDAHGLHRATLALAHTERVDPLVDRIASALPEALESGPVRDALGGRWLGHALHPLLTDLPLGTWMSASLLDVLPGRGTDGAAEKLLTFGLLAALPTVAAGWSDWTHASRDERRVGVAHAAVNGTAALLYLGSLVARKARRHRLGVALGISGGLTAIVGGYLGGHLSAAMDTALRNTADVTG
jgi:hypothetical protein